MAARAPINGSTLQWARSASRVQREELARAAGVSADRISEFEAEQAAPTFRQLTLIAARLDRPLGFFFAPPPDRSDVPETADFRGRDGTVDVPAALAREMKRAEQHRAAMLDLADAPTREWQLTPITYDSAPQAAAELRATFGLTDRFTPPEAALNQVLNFWRGLVESQSFLVFQATGITLASFRGLSIYHETLPIIILNGADSPTARVFTLFHELAHLANRTSGLCGLDDDVSEEAVANRFAANFLMPEALVRQHVDPETFADPIEQAEAIANALKVSLLAAGVRLRTLGLISPTDFEAIRQRSAELWQAVRDRQKQSEGFVPPWRLRFRDLGSTYIGTIAHALEDQRIDAVDATYLLNARWPMVEQMLQEYYRTGVAE
ncbi:helix-turn-helix domain-containing protein [Nakamurella endophytica]|uniref:HTH cro/C1-type domain-containing protein n=1 Tax=Nakamurella endophytica TaxID=1748367 RepID=A0A917T876_9ACTN|nr:XRE family transcriptional regulator [Nakamurella endophytica]GGM14306.1 hypothetical protein GCM10011594_37910 [Nakamurella endophytica]